MICRKTFRSEDWSSRTSNISSKDCISDPAISIAVTKRPNMFYRPMARRFLFVLLAGGGLIVGSISFRVSSADLTGEAALVFGGQAGTDCPGCGFSDADGFLECQGSDPCMCTTEINPIFGQLPPPACATESRDPALIYFAKRSGENFDANTKPISTEMPCKTTYVCRYDKAVENRRCWTLFGDPCWTWSPLYRCTSCRRDEARRTDVFRTNEECISCPTTPPGGFAMVRY